MQNLPAYIYILFIAATLFTVYFLYRASAGNRAVLTVVSIWIAAQGIIAFSGFYLNTGSVPPRFALALIPPMVCIVMLFILPAGRRFIDGFNTRWLTWLHLVRIPVEIVLYSLFIHKMVPAVMTFEGRNFDVLSGLSAPFIAWFGYHKMQIKRGWMLLWNFICLGLLINVVVTALLSAPFKFQQLGFEQPNVGIFYFPFIWLPCFIVPVVLLAHLICIRQLWRDNLKV